MKLFTAFLLVLLITGCETSRIFVNYKSNPTGAILYCDDKRYGNTPIIVEHKLSDKENKQKFFIPDCSARWVSGANSKITKISTKVSGLFAVDADFSGSYKKTSYTFERPKHPNIGKDEEFAIKVLQIEATKEATNASLQAKRAAESAEYEAKQAKQRAEETKLQIITQPRYGY